MQRMQIHVFTLIVDGLESMIYVKKVNYTVAIGYI